MSNIQKLYEIAEVAKHSPFTAEKQLKLIEWFVKTFAEIETLEINYGLNDCFQVSSCNSVSKFEFEFGEALASFIFNLYSDLTDDQKEEIKRILDLQQQPKAKNDELKQTLAEIKAIQEKLKAFEVDLELFLRQSLRTTSKIGHDGFYWDADLYPDEQSTCYVDFENDIIENILGSLKDIRNAN